MTHIIELCNRKEQERINKIKDDYSFNLSLIYGYESELYELCELYSGNAKNADNALNYFGIYKFKPSAIKVKEFILQLQQIRGLKTNTKDSSIYKHSTDKQLMTDFFNCFLEDISKTIGRNYELSYCDNELYLLAVDETNKEYINRRLKVNSWVEYLIPVFGQLLFVTMLILIAKRKIKGR